MILIVFFRYFMYKFKTFGVLGFECRVSGFARVSVFGVGFGFEVVPLGFRGFGSLTTSLMRQKADTKILFHRIWKKEFYLSSLKIWSWLPLRRCPSKSLLLPIIDWSSQLHRGSHGAAMAVGGCVAVGGGFWQIELWSKAQIHSLGFSHVPPNWSHCQ